VQGGFYEVRQERPQALANWGDASSQTPRHHVLRMTDTNQRAGKVSPSWRWTNIPIPEPHIVGVLASGVLHLARPWRLPGSKRLYSGAGWALVGTGVAISASAVRAASDVDLERPSTLTSTGPYAISRNPMYVGWTLLYVGGALITRNAWMVASVPVVAKLIHRDVLREEHTLEQTFGEEYSSYRRRVRRYL
jgi:protein-S-isoprenylcysteine O-methyltransferase Ste14